MKKFIALCCLLSLILLPSASFAQDDDMMVSPIPGAECTPDVAPEGDPIVIGGSLSLTGVFAPTANIHRVVGEVIVDWVNECGGLLGRPVEWTLLDDQSSPEQVTANYERLITVDGVDLIMGPYGGGNILAGAGPAQQNGYVYPTHTNGVPDVDLGEYHFPSWQIGGGSEEGANPWGIAGAIVWDALESTGEEVSNAYYLVNKFPTTQRAAEAAREDGEARGIETIDYIEYDLGTSDFSSIALRISAEDPDFIYMSGIAIDGVNLYDAFESIGYIPHGLYVILPSPGPMMGLGEVAEGTMSLSIFENHAPFTDNPVTAEFIERFEAAATEQELYSVVETQAAASISAWQSLLAAVVATESLDNDVLKDWLAESEIEVAAGTISFDGFNGFGTDFSRIIQIQDGQRVIVWPPEFAPEGVTVNYPTG